MPLFVSWLIAALAVACNTSIAVNDPLAGLLWAPFTLIACVDFTIEAWR